MRSKVLMVIYLITTILLISSGLFFPNINYLKPQDVYGIELISPNLKGLGYTINVYVYNNEFYFASRGFDKCVKTSQGFSLWLKSILASSKGEN